jgi:hypothetical protein
MKFDELDSKMRIYEHSIGQTIFSEIYRCEI